MVRIGTGTDDPTKPHEVPDREFGSGRTLAKEEFHDASGATVVLIRGFIQPLAAGQDLPLPSGLGLDRIAFAIEGLESDHGQNPAMWRSDLRGPQGPMQISEPAALDVGGGNRFDVTENRLLARAYLARLYLRYGNWPDAIAAYNWGPGRVDTWVSNGRPENKLPDSVHYYLSHVLKASGL